MKQMVTEINTKLTAGVTVVLKEKFQACTDFMNQKVTKYQDIKKRSATEVHTKSLFLILICICTYMHIYSGICKNNFLAYTQQLISPSTGSLHLPPNSYPPSSHLLPNSHLPSSHLALMVIQTAPCMLEVLVFFRAHGY
ncbi:hypothetical protein EV426DRAFT_585252 [Tirmania nivea]|nr:hypothetical protein EV426DRAFT_585252 [Tirmania nivea]